MGNTAIVRTVVKTCLISVEHAIWRAKKPRGSQQRSVISSLPSRELVISSSLAPKYFRVHLIERKYVRLIQQKWYFQ